MKNAISQIAKVLVVMVVAFSHAVAAHAATPGITGTTFTLTAQQAFLNQPDGEAVYSWGYGCVTPPAASAFLPQINGAPMAGATCSTMQVPGPTLIVTEGQTIQISLTNNLPTAAGNTSILFPGLTLQSATGGVAGLLTMEAQPGQTVTYTVVASAAGTHAYYSGTQQDLQIEMGLYGAVVVLPNNPGAGTCDTNNVTNLYGKSDYGTSHGIAGFPEQDFRLAHAAYDHPKTCYDREYLFQWAEMDARIHKQALAQVSDASRMALCASGATTPGCSLNVQTEPYHPSYFLINGRSMPDLMDPNYAGEYPHQPYNGNPHIHPGEQMLIRTIGQGRWQHPYHEHANHVRILARDGNLILSPTNPAANLAGILMFNTDTTPGESFDGIFYFSGRGLNWDPYGHKPTGTSTTGDSLATLSCTPDANGFNTGNVGALNYYEWCQDHDKPVEVAPFGDVAAGGPATLPDPNVFTNGQWYGGTPYFGPDASLRASMSACAPGTSTNGTGTAAAPFPSCTTLNPANTQANPANERGWAFMWHSHNEREITTDNVFPGGMLMMLLVDSREFAIDESL